jgi:hypothetical protein
MTRVELGVFVDGVPTNIVIPKDALRPAERIFEREEAARRKAADLAKLQVLRAANSQRKLKKAMAACFGRRGRGR